MDRYISSLGWFQRDSEVNFELRLMLGDVAQSLEGVDIEVTVFTSQLSRRKRIYSFADIHAESVLVSDAGGSIYRGDKSWTLSLLPELLGDLDRGVLTLLIKYRSPLFEVSSLITTERFV